MLLLISENFKNPSLTYKQHKTYCLQVPFESTLHAWFSLEWKPYGFILCLIFNMDSKNLNLMSLGQSAPRHRDGKWQSRNSCWLQTSSSLYRPFMLHGFFLIRINGLCQVRTDTFSTRMLQLCVSKTEVASPVFWNTCMLKWWEIKTQCDLHSHPFVQLS